MPIYTSSYTNILERAKEKHDIYIQISRDLGQYEAPGDSSGLIDLIDEDWGYEFGNWWGSKLNYKQGVRKKDLRLFAKHLRELQQNYDIFLLCFEDVLAGENCHRRWLAEIFEKGFSLKIPEFNLEQLPCLRQIHLQKKIEIEIKIIKERLCIEERTGIMYSCHDNDIVKVKKLEELRMKLNQIIPEDVIEVYEISLEQINEYSR